MNHFLIGSVAAGAVELLKLYELRGKLTRRVYTKMASSPMFWAVVAGMVAASGFFTWAFYDGNPSPRTFEVAMMGIAVRSLVRDGVASAAVKQVNLGRNEAEDDAFPLRAMFQ